MNFKSIEQARQTHVKIFSPNDGQIVGNVRRKALFIQRLWGHRSEGSLMNWCYEAQLDRKIRLCNILHFKTRHTENATVCSSLKSCSSSKCMSSSKDVALVRPPLGGWLLGLLGGGRSICSRDEPRWRDIVRLAAWCKWCEYVPQTASKASRNV